MKAVPSFPSYCLVTGTGGGIGKALVKALEEFSFPVAAFSRGGDSSGDLSPLPHPADSAWHFTGDLSDFDRMDMLLSTLIAAWGPPFLVVHNASVLFPRIPLWEEDGEHVRQTLRINLEVPMFWVSCLVPGMIRAKRGGHVFVSSTVGRVARPNWGTYAVSKAGIEALSANLALELPSPLFSFSLNPGAVMTRMRQKAYPDKDPADRKSPEEAARILARFLARLREPDAGRAYNGRRMDLDRLEDRDA